MENLFTERSTLLVGGLVVVLILMRIGLALVSPTSWAGLAILWFWHPDARVVARRRLLPAARQERGEDDQVLTGLYEPTLQNMDSTLVALAIVFFVIRPFVVQAFYIPSSSMEPTLMGNSARKDRVLVNKYIYRTRAPRRQEIIVFHAPPAALDDPSKPQDFIKRLIGVPGDTVQVRNNRVLINGKPLDEPYLDDEHIAVSSFRMSDSRGDPANWGPVKVPPGKYLVLGDNRNNSRDSRLWFDANRAPAPFLDADQVLGKAMCVFWPPKALKLLRTPGNN